MKLLGLMDSLSSQLRDAINSPSEDTQRAVQSTREVLTTKLREAKSNSMSPGMRVDLGQLKVGDRTPVADLIGVGLQSRLDTAFNSGGGYVSVGSLDQISHLLEDLQKLHDALQQLNRGAEELAVRTEQLEPGESVVGFTIPRSAVDEELDRLQKEVIFFGRLVSMVAEVVDGSSEGPVKVHSLQSSDFGIDLMTSLSAAAALATLVDYLVRGLKKLGEMRAVKDQMQKLSFDQKFLDEVDQKGETTINAAIEEFETEIFQNQKVDNEGRVNELKAGIRIHSKGLAARLERGYSVEVRTELLAEPTADQEEQGASISALSQIRFERATPLLKLTDGEEEPASSKKGPGKKTARKRASLSTE